jgi:hypothetical protein
MLREVLPVRASRATRARWITTWRAWGCDSRVLLTYLHAWETGAEAKAALARDFAFYHGTRSQEARGYRTPDELYFRAGAAEEVA